MLVLTRKSEESVILGDDIEIKVLGVKGDQVTLGFSAPSDVSIFRKEIYEAIKKENLNAATDTPEDAQQTENALKRQISRKPSATGSEPG